MNRPIPYPQYVTSTYAKVFEYRTTSLYCIVSYDPVECQYLAKVATQEATHYHELSRSEYPLFIKELIAEHPPYQLPDFLVDY